MKRNPATSRQKRVLRRIQTIDENHEGHTDEKNTEHLIVNQCNLWPTVRQSLTQKQTRSTPVSMHIDFKNTGESDVTEHRRIQL